MKLTVHHHPVPRLNSEALPLLPHMSLWHAQRKLYICSLKMHIQIIQTHFRPFYNPTLPCICHSNVLELLFIAVCTLPHLTGTCQCAITKAYRKLNVCTFQNILTFEKQEKLLERL